MIAKPTMWYPGFNREHPLARRTHLCLPAWEGDGAGVQDVGDNGYDGILESPALPWVGSPYGHALDLSTDTPGSLTCGTEAGNGLGLQMTVAIIMYRKATDPTNAIFVYKGTYQENGWYLGQQNPGWLFRTNQTSADQRTKTTTSLPLKQWISVVVTLRGATARLFVNAIEVAYVAQDSHIAPAASTRQLRVSGGAAASTQPSYMYCAGIWMWEYGLTPLQVRLWHADPFAKVRPPPSYTRYFAPAAGFVAYPRPRGLDGGMSVVAGGLVA